MESFGFDIKLSLSYDNGTLEIMLKFYKIQTKGIGIENTSSNLSKEPIHFVDKNIIEIFEPTAI